MNYREVLRQFNMNQYQDGEHWYDLVDPMKENPNFFEENPELKGTLYMKLGTHNLLIFARDFVEICSPIQPDNAPEIDITVFYKDIVGLKFLYISGEIDIYIKDSIIRVTQTIHQSNYWQQAKKSKLFAKKTP